MQLLGKAYRREDKSEVRRNAKTGRAHLCKLKFACVLNRGFPLAEGLPAFRAGAYGNYPHERFRMTETASWYSCNVKVISRSGTRTAVGAAAYITGTKLVDRELEAAPGYKPSDFSRKGGVEKWFIDAPEQSPQWTYDIETLCNEAQARDTRKNSCTARVGRLSLPNSADAEGREEIAREFAGYLKDRYQVPVIASIHAPDRHGDDRNWHMHYWFPTRRMDENGLGAKTRVLDDRKTGSQEITYIREAAADIINRYLEEAGSDERVDHRSFEDRGSPYLPTIHLGSAASALEREGIRTERGDINRAVREHNHKIDQLVTELAEVEADIAQELEKEFSSPPMSMIKEELLYDPVSPPIQTQSEPEIKNVLADPAPADPPTVLTWEQQKREAQSPFTSPVTLRMQRDIEETGAIRENGLGQNWYDRTMVMFEHFYETGRDVIRDIKENWREYIGWSAGKNDPDKGDRER